MTSGGAAEVGSVIDGPWLPGCLSAWRRTSWLVVMRSMRFGHRLHRSCPGARALRRTVWPAIMWLRRFGHRLSLAAQVLERAEEHLVTSGDAVDAVRSSIAPEPEHVGGRCDQW